MVGAMARLAIFGKRLGRQARAVYTSSALYQGDSNSLWNNLAQAIEIVEAIEQSEDIIDTLTTSLPQACHEKVQPSLCAGQAAGAVECPRGTLYHFYELDDKGRIVAADMITPSAQNTSRIELDIREVVGQSQANEPAILQENLETLIRAYDPCNTCATHMVSIAYK